MTIRSNGLKGYVYRKKGTENPIKTSPHYTEGEPTEPPGELFYIYEPSLGKDSDPRAYINSRGENIVDLLWQISMHTSEPTQKMKQFGQKGFRSKESMVKQFNEMTYEKIYAIPGGILSKEWQSESDDDWRVKYRQDKSTPMPQHHYFPEAYTYADWLNGDVYGGRIVDVPGEDSSENIVFVESERDIPNGRIHKDYPRAVLGQYDRKRLEEQMSKEIRDSRPKDSRKYYLKGAYAYDMTDSDLRQLGIKVEDMKVGDSGYYKGKGGVEFRIQRSASLKPRKPMKRRW